MSFHFRGKLRGREEHVDSQRVLNFIHCLVGEVAEFFFVLTYLQLGLFVLVCSAKEGKRRGECSALLLKNIFSCSSFACNYFLLSEIDVIRTEKEIRKEDGIILGEEGDVIPLSEKGNFEAKKRSKGSRKGFIETNSQELQN